MRLPVAHVEQLLAVERHRRDLKQYVKDTIPTAHARVFVDRHLESDTSRTGNPATWQPPGSGPRSRPNPTGNLQDGLIYIVRHLPGL